MSFKERYGPWALIAGASDGTGKAFARQVAAEGLNCILIARREGPLTELAETIRSESGVECITASIDLTGEDASDRMIEATGGREVGLFIMNAGSDQSGASFFLERKLDHWIDLARRNVMNVTRFCYHHAGLMQARKRGGIILVGSGSGYGGMKGFAIYGATKAFQLTLAEALWTELRDDGVDVLSLMMGKTDTPTHLNLLKERGLPRAPDTASSEDVAALGLARLPHGPVQNWGLEDDEAAFALTSAATRRKRILMIDEATKDYTGKK